MLFFRHPKPDVDNRAVAVQVVQQQARAGSVTPVLVAAPRAGAGSALTAAPTAAPAAASMPADPA